MKKKDMNALCNKYKEIKNEKERLEAEMSDIRDLLTREMKEMGKETELLLDDYHLKIYKGTETVDMFTLKIDNPVLYSKLRKKYPKKGNPTLYIYTHESYERHKEYER